MRITSLPPSLTPTSTSAGSPVARTSFGARIGGAAAPVAGGAPGGRSIVAAALASQQASPNGAVLGAYSKAMGVPQKQMAQAHESNFSATLAKANAQKDQDEALRTLAHLSVINTATSIFSMSGKGITLDQE